MFCDEIVIKANGLGKCFDVFDSPHQRLSNILFGSERGKSEFWALKDISFEVRKGETVGIIGRNGAGKSTLLQMLCGTLIPSVGEVQVNGKVAALLELGAGFNPEFTGRENIYLNASILGLSQSNIDNIYDKIVAFSELADYIDKPVKTYSSGMYVRLGFAVAAHTDADVLIIDEALSVGDVFFQQKCMRFLSEFKERGGTLLFVSHDTSSVLSLCENAILLYPRASKPCVKGPSDDICKLYVSELYQEKTDQFASFNVSPPVREPASINKELVGKKNIPDIYKLGTFRTDAESFGERGASIVSCCFTDGSNIISEAISGQKVSLNIEVKCDKDIVFPAAGIMIKDNKGQYLFTEGSDHAFRDEQLIFRKGERVLFEFTFEMPVLIRGSYTINVAFAEGIGDDHIQHHWLHDALDIEVLQSRVVHGSAGLNGFVPKLKWIVPNE
ncbi:ABC transporter ATP-binding protein [Vibrio cholerae]|uniref:ABC transporter ATP-binding protein n=1 Tax=Vibrio cholerae TaxID=666 RepID=UPI000C7E9F0E|nr:ABC transporter ATP-binding protein [Vibrio cholerae]PKQ51873.1 sugar ABC transporter ATP-binding protein [Vibrio cholerae]TXY76816.1 ABC transporter ATP-binding protein [Vibrio cholerae]BCN16756.1 putative O-antigen export system, ATP binding protein [Vibrio cholerae]GHX13735.1 Teichoic acids export ATP-binding protein TagH [Vibrio cholerae]